MGKTVMTVTEPIPPECLGLTLIHEHVTFAYPGWYVDNSLAPYDLIDMEKRRAVRVWLKDEFFGNMLNSPFVAQSERGVLPQDVQAEAANPLMAKVLNIPDEMFPEIGLVMKFEVAEGKSCLDTKLCAQCGEQVFVDTLTETGSGPVCIPCRNKG